MRRIVRCEYATTTVACGRCRTTAQVWYNAGMARDYPEWERLQAILAVIGRQGCGALQAAELIEFGKLYRRAATELAFQRAHGADAARLAFLNDLVGRCYPHVYVAPHTPWPSVARFFTTDFPCAIRRHLGWILLATLAALIPAAIGFLLTWHDRTLADQILPAQLMEMLDPLAERHHTASEWASVMHSPEMMGRIITNNVQISIMAFGGGMTAGIFTLYLLIFNGLMLGVIGAAVALDGASTMLNFWAFVAPHGVFELTAIFISGGAGLLLAYAIINPGEVPRATALKRAGREALLLMLGVAAMLVLAGTVESWYSPRNVPEADKLLVAALEATLLTAYFALAGRRAATIAPSPSHQITPLPPV